MPLLRFRLPGRLVTITYCPSNTGVTALASLVSVCEVMFLGAWGLKQIDAPTYSSEGWCTRQHLWYSLRHRCKHFFIRAEDQNVFVFHFSCFIRSSPCHPRFSTTAFHTGFAEPLRLFFFTSFTSRLLPWME